MGAFHFKIENRRDILNITLLTRITAQHKQWESKHKYHIQLLGNIANELDIKLYNYS